MKILKFIILLLLFNNCKQTETIEICKKLDKNKVEYISQNIVYTSSASSQKLYKVKHESIIYDIGFSADSVVNYISTNDLNFSVNKLTIGTKYSYIPKELIKNEFYSSGLGYLVTLKSNWVVLFSDKKILDSHEIYTSAKIISFFKQCIDD